MKISVNDQELFSLSTIQKEVIKNEIQTELCDEDLRRRLEWVLKHKYEQCFKRLKTEWDKKLADNKVAMIPTDPDEYAKLVFAQPNYKNRSARELEEKSRGNN